MNTNSDADVYFSCAMSNQQNDVRQRNTNFGRALKSLCDQIGLKLFDPEEKDVQGGYDDGQVFLNEIEIIKNCEMMVLLLDSPSCGAGGEATACYLFSKFLEKDISIILVSSSPDDVSKFVLENPQLKKIIVYTDMENVMTELEQVMVELMKKQQQIVIA